MRKNQVKMIEIKKLGIRDNTRDRLTTAEVRVSEVKNRSTEFQKKKRGMEGMIWRDNSREFFKPTERHETTDLRSAEDPKQDKYQNHITSKLLTTKKKEKILKAAKVRWELGTHITFRGTKKRITEDFSSKTMQARRQWCNIFKVLKEKDST